LQAVLDSGLFRKEDLVLLYKKYVHRVIILANRNVDRTITARNVLCAKSAPPDSTNRYTAERTRNFLSSMALAGFGYVTKKIKNHFLFTAKPADEMDSFCSDFLKIAESSYR